MPEGVDVAIDSTQQEVKGMLREAKPEQQGLLLPEEVYTSKVDEIQELGEKLHSEEAKKYMGTAKGQINQLLISIAVAGSKYLDDISKGQNAGPESKDAKTLERTICDLRVRLDSYKPNIDTMVQIEACANKTETLLVIQNLDQQSKANPEYFGSADYMTKISEGLVRLTDSKSKIVSTTGLPQEFSVSMLKNIDEQITMFTTRKTNALKYAMITIKYNQYFDFQLDDNHQIQNLKPTEAFYRLPEDGQKNILETIATVCELSVNQEVVTASYPLQLKQAQQLFQEGKFEEAKVKYQEFEKYLDTPEFKSNKALASRGDQYREVIRTQLKLVDTFTGEHKPFFDAQKALAAGDFMGAKKVLLEYIKKTYEPPQPQFIQGAKELLHRIAMSQLEEAEEQFKSIPAPMEASMGSGGTMGAGSDTAENSDREYRNYVAVKKALEYIRQTLTRGESYDFSEAAKGVKPPLDFAALEAQNNELNIIGDQLLLEEGRPGLLKLAQKYRKLGKQELAERYYRAYFRERLTKPDILTRDQFLERCKQDGKMLTAAVYRAREIREKISTDTKFREEFKKQNPGLDIDSFSEKDAVNMIIQQMADEGYSRAMGRSAMNVFNDDPASFGEDQENFKDFADLMGVHKTGTWREGMLEFSDQEWSDFASRVVVEVVIVAACAAVSGGVGGAVVGTALRRQTAKIALKVGEETAAEMMAAGMVADSGLVTAARLSGFAAESGVFAASSHFAHASQQGKFEIFGEDFMMEWLSSAATLGGLGGVGRVMGEVTRAAELGAISTQGLSRLAKARLALAKGGGRTFGKAGELAYMGAEAGAKSGGEHGLTLDDLALVIGLDLGHRAIGKDHVVERIKLEETTFPEGIKKPEQIITARILDDGRIVINGKVVEGLDASRMVNIHESMRRRIEELAPQNALNTHFFSRFSGSKDVPPQFLADPSKPADDPVNVESIRNLHGWVDINGNTHYNMEFINGYKVETIGEGGEKIMRGLMPDGYTLKTNADGQPIIRTTDGNEISYKEYQKSVKGTPYEGLLANKLFEIKVHEYTHMNLEFGYTKEVIDTDGVLVRVVDKQKAQPLLDLFAVPDAQGNVPAGKIALKDVKGNPMPVTFENVQEFLSYVADGSISASKGQVAAVEKIIQTQLAGFHFDHTVQYGTKLIAENDGRALMRTSPAAMKIVLRKGEGILERQIRESLDDTGIMVWQLSPEEIQKVQSGDTSELQARLTAFRTRAKVILGYEPRATLEADKRSVTIRLRDRRAEAVDSGPAAVPPRPDKGGTPDQISDRQILQIFSDPSRRKEFNSQKVDEIIDRVIQTLAQNPETKPWDISQSYVQLDRPMSASEVAETRARIVRLYEKYNHGETIDPESGNIYFPATETGSLPLGSRTRKTYISPPFDRLPEFMDRLFPILQKMGVKYDPPKIHQEDLRFENGKLVAQKQNTVCFYFRSDAEMAKFTEAVAEAERTSGIGLLQFPGAVSYGQIMDGKINFGVDSSTHSYDVGMDKFYRVLSDGYREGKKRGMKQDDLRVYLRSIAQDFWGRESGINIDQFFDLGTTPQEIQDHFSRLTQNDIDYPLEQREKLGKTFLQGIKSTNPASLEAARNKVRTSQGDVRFPFDPNASPDAILARISAYELLAAEEGYKVTESILDQNNKVVILRLSKK